MLDYGYSKAFLFVLDHWGCQWRTDSYCSSSLYGATGHVDPCPQWFILLVPLREQCIRWPSSVCCPWCYGSTRYRETHPDIGKVSHIAVYLRFCCYTWTCVHKKTRVLVFPKDASRKFHYYATGANDLNVM